MKQVILKIAANRALTPSVCRLDLTGDTGAVTAPGQFADVMLPGRFLRRPFSVCDVSGDRLTLLYKIAGSGTELLSSLPAGTELNVLTGLGNGFDVERAGARPLLVGGGTGVSPLYLLAKRLRERGKEVSAVLGFASAVEVLFEKEFRDLGCNVTVTTADGSYGAGGFVTDALPEGCTHLYACGPEPMLRALCAALDIPGQVSLEARMGCGFGACMGCTVDTAAGPRRVCKDGPVFDREELLW